MTITGYFAGRPSTSRGKKEEIIRRGVQWNLSNPYSDDDLYHHFRLRDAILNKMCDDGKIASNQFDQVEDFYINYAKQLITFTIPGTSDKAAVAFEDVKGTAKEDIEYLIRRVNTELFYGYKVPLIGTSKAKSNATGPAPLQRKSTAARALTKDFDDSMVNILPTLLVQAPNVKRTRQKIVRRMEYANFVTYRMKREIGIKLQEKTQEIQRLEDSHTADADGQIRVLRKEISDLRNLLNQFNNVDAYALTIALSALPVGSYGYDALERATTFVQNQVRADLEAKLGKSRWSLRKQKLNESDEAYIKSVAGLLHKSRGEYATYCQRQGMKPERESVEDLILREALRVSDMAEFKEENVKGAVSLSGMSPELQTEVAGIFDYLDRLSSVFPEDKDNDNKERKYKGSEPDPIKAQLFARHNQIRWDDREVSPRRHRVFNARNGLIAAGIGTGIYAAEQLGFGVVNRIEEAGRWVFANPGAIGTAFMGLMGFNHVRRWWSYRDQFSYVIAGSTFLMGLAMRAAGLGSPMEVLQLARANPAASAALVSTAHAATRAVHDYVAPVTGPETGLLTRSTRRINWKRAALVLSVGSLLTYNVASLYQLMFSNDTEEQNLALGYLSGTVDMVWNHCIIAGIAIPIVKSVVDSYVGGTVGRVTSGALGVLENVTKVSQTYFFASELFNRVSGFFSWSTSDAPPLLAPPDTDEAASNVVGASSVVEYRPVGEQGSIPEVIALNAMASDILSNSVSNKLVTGAVWIAGESLEVLNKTRLGKMFGNIFRPALNY